MIFRLILIDDEEDILLLEEDLIKETFDSNKIPIETKTFTKSREALNFIKENPDWADAVLTDLHMPIANGLELIRYVKLMTRAECLIYSGYVDGYEVGALNDELVSYGKSPAMVFHKPDVSGTLGIPGYLTILAQAKRVAHE